MSMGEIKLYDTIKDKDGNRYRVTEVSDSLGVIKAVRIKGEEQVSCGRPRMIKMVDIDGHKYMKVKSIPPVTVTHQEPKPSEKAAEKQSATVHNYNVASNDPEARIKALMEVIDRQANKITELEEELKAREFYPVDEGTELKDRIQECIDLKKTISKMQQKREEDIAVIKAELDRYKKAEQDLREINEELGEENHLLNEDCEKLKQENRELKKSNAALIGIADSTAMSIGIINKLMEERG